MGIKLSKGHTTHLPMLIKLVQATSGPVLELGAGATSTPVLHWLCAESRRRLLTCEDSAYWWQYAKRFATPTHRTRFVEDWDALDLSGPWSVVLVDHRAERRVADALRLLDVADYLVIHDTHDRISYGWERLWPECRDVYHWTFCSPHTSVVSNRKSLDWLRDPLFARWQGTKAYWAVDESLDLKKYLTR